MTLTKFVLNDIIFPLTGALTGGAIAYGTIRYMNRPGPAYVLEIIRDPRSPGTVSLNYIHRTYPRIHSFEHKSLKCLQERGYDIIATDHTAWRHDVKHYKLGPNDSDWIQQNPNISPHEAAEMLRISKRSTVNDVFDIDEFLSDCKECKVRTEVKRIEESKRESKDLLPSQHIDRHDWHKCYVYRKQLW